MRRVSKGDPIESFSDYSANNPGATWDTFHRDARQCYLDSRMQILIEEQDCLCGYTEICIANVTDAHLDHYHKKSIFPEMTFAWDNLIAATLDSDFGANYKDSVYKIKKEEYPAIFNPAAEDVHTYLYYNQRGEIEPQSTLNASEKIKVKKTIEVFNLNHPSLRTRRETIINQIRNCVGSLSIEEIISAFSASGFKSVVLQEAN